MATDATSKIGGLIAKAIPSPLSIAEGAVSTLTGVFTAIGNFSLKKQYQQFQENLMAQEQRFSDSLHLTTQLQTNSNAVTTTSNDFYLGVQQNAQSQSTKYLISAGVVLVLGIGAIILIRKSNNN